MSDACPTCGMWTQAGRDKATERARANPIWNTDFTKPLSASIEEIRSRIANVRGTLHDIESAFPGWKDRLEPVEGLLTCGLIALHGVRKEMLAVEARKAAPSDEEA